MAHVDFQVQLHDGDRGTRTRGEAQVVRPPLTKALVPRQARRPHIHADWFAPFALHRLDDLAHLLGGFPEGMIRGPGPAGIGPVDHERRCALGIGRGEEQGQRPALGDTEEHRALGAGGVHDRSHVIHSLLEGRDVTNSIGEPRATLVEADEP